MFDQHVDRTEFNQTDPNELNFDIDKLGKILDKYEQNWPESDYANNDRESDLAAD